MTFPLCSLTHGSLCSQIIVAAQAVECGARASIQELFPKIATLHSLCAFDIGNAKELGQCSSLLASGRVLTAEERGLHGDLLHRVLAGSDQGANKQAQLQPHNLCEALSQKRADLPQLDQLLPALTEVINQSQLQCHFVSELQATLTALYPLQERSDLEAKAWREFIYGQETRSSSIHEILEKFTNQFSKSELWRDCIEQLRQRAKQNPDRVQELILASPTYRSANAHEQLHLFQISLNALLAEESNLSKLKALFVDLEDLMPLSDHSQSLKQIAASSRNENIHLLNAIIDAQKAVVQKIMIACYQHFANRVEKVFSELRFEKNPTPQQRAHRVHHCLVKAKKIRQSIAVSPLPKALEDQQQVWSSYCQLLAKWLDHHLFHLRVSHRLAQLVEHSDLFFNAKSPHFEHLSSTAPALSLISSRFVEIWRAIFTVDNPLESKQWQLLADARQALEILEITKEYRSELYNLQKGHLIKAMERTPDRRKALQYNAIFLASADQGRPLPKDLQMPRSVQRVDRAQQDSIIGDKEREACALMTWARSRVRMGSWLSPFTYHPRVLRWFSADLPLHAAAFPEYVDKSPDYQALMIRLHRLIPLADFFCQRGLEWTSTSWRGQSIKRIALPAEIEFQQRAQTGIVIWAINAHHVCFHRFFHIKLKTDCLINTVQKALEKTLQNFEEEQVGKAARLELSHGSGDSAEIDHLTGVATLKDPKSPNLILRLKFIEQAENER